MSVNCTSAQPVGATQLYLMVVNTLQRRTLEMEHRANLQRLESMLGERAEQMRRAVELQAGMLPVSPLIEDGFELAASAWEHAVLPARIWPFTNTW